MESARSTKFPRKNGTSSRLDITQRALRGRNKKESETMDGRVLVASALSLILAACGGGGGGGGAATPPGPTVTGSGPAPSSGPGDTMAYFPLVAGNQWLYNSTDSGTNTPSLIFDVTVAVNGTKTIQGQLATIFTRSDSSTTAAPTDQYYASSGGGITYLGTTDPVDTITPLLIPYPQLLFPVATGTVSSITGKNLAFGKDTAGTAITLSLTQTIVNSGLETVSVPAGTFTNAMKQVTTVNGTAVDGSQSIPVSGTDTVWLAPGVGQVKETSVVNASGTSITNTFDLKGFAVNGQSHGFGPPKVLTAASPTGADTNAALASDGANFLLVTHHTLSNPLTLNWVGTLLARDGTIIKTFDITAPVNPVAVTAGAAAAAYDGSNYLVVYVPDLNPGGQPDTLEAIRISPAGTILGPAITVAPAIQASSSCAMAFDGTNYLLIYLLFSDTNSPQLLGELLSPTTGQPLGPSFPIAPAGGSQDSPALAFDGTNYLVAWEELQSAASLGLDAARVSPAGAVLDASPLRLLDTSALPTSNFTPSAYPAVSFDGTNYLVAYQDVRTGGVTISASRVSSSGKLLDGSSTQPGIVVTSDPTLRAQRLGTAFLGGQYWLIWQSYSSGSSLFGARVSTGGLLVSPGTNGFVLNDIYPNGTQLISANAGSGVIVWQAESAPPVTEAGISFRTIFP
jgi:hypothetical protein